jgi:hypothetical protein
MPNVGFPQNLAETGQSGIGPDFAATMLTECSPIWDQQRTAAITD